MLSLRAISSLCLLLSLAPSTALAQTTLVTGLGGAAGFGTSCLSPNDDSSSSAIDLTSAFPSGLRFFSNTHRSMVVNTNGNISFSGAVSRYTPTAFPVASQPMIAPFWADVDLRTGSDCTMETDGGGNGAGACRNPSDNGVWWNLEPGRIVVTWNRVGYYRCHTDRRMNFQLILSDPSLCGGEPGDFDVEFRYNQCEWHTGDASGGGGGQCAPPPPPPLPATPCVPAQSGFDAGDTRNFVSIRGSMSQAIAYQLCNNSNVGDRGVWRFQIRRGAVLCLDAGRPCDTGMTGVCGEGRTACEGSGTVCRVVNTPRDEVCDGADNNCNGMVDDGAMCPVGERCLRGRCTGECVEGACFDGYVCVRGQCIEQGCETLECPEGQRCAMGRCVGACDGVVCPVGQICRAGRCFDPCEGVTCPSGQVCELGACVPQCGRCRSCREGEACGAGGRCVQSACAEVTCDGAQTCRDGACGDPCDGVVCPVGDTCSEGQCRQPGATVTTDGGVRPGSDAGSADGGALDGGSTGPGFMRATGCACRTTGVPSSSRSTLLFAVAAAFALRRRVRARR